MRNQSKHTLRVAPIQLARTHISRILVEENRSRNKDAEEPEGYMLGVYYDPPSTPENPEEHLSVTLHFALKKASEACRIGQVDLAVTGYFQLASTPPAEVMDSYILPSCVNVLYGFVRGYLATVTALFEQGAVMVPSIDSRSIPMLKTEAESGEAPQDATLEQQEPTKKRRTRKKA